MSITVNIYYKGKNGSAKEFVKEMTESGVVDKIRKEEGNEKYEYYFSQKDPETVLLIDRWKDQESLDIHHASPMMEQRQETFRTNRGAITPFDISPKRYDWQSCPFMQR